MIYNGVFYIFCFVFWISVNCQFHLYHTYDPVVDVPLFFDCLYYKVLDDTFEDETISIDFKPVAQFIPYCIRPDFADSLIKNEEKENKRVLNGNKISFGHMQRIGVTVSDLLAWSAPIDIVELYQDFLQNPTNLTIFHVFYNCTWPWFGPECQYTFDAVNVHSINSIVRHTFIEKLPADPNDYHYPPWFNNLTCYTLVTCNRGLESLCLDWREICDGQIDCLNDGIDEIGCFRLHVNKCEKDEFQCDNGMCVPLMFLNDSSFNFDCMDGSDEKSSIIGQFFIDCIHDPTFRCEELAYTYGNDLAHFFCGDGQTCNPYMDDYWCCRNGRKQFLQEKLMSRLANKHIIDDNCWLIMYCALNAFSSITTDCTSICPRKQQTCRFDIGSRCSSPYVVFPQHPVIPGHVHFLYLSNKTIVHVAGHMPLPDYVCVEKKHCPFLQGVVYIDGKACVNVDDMQVTSPIGILYYFKSYLFINETGHLTHCCDSCSDENECNLQKEKKLNVNCLRTYFADDFDTQYNHRTSDKRNNVMHSGNDENIQTQTIRFLFSMICNGFVNYLPPELIDGLNETDETNCEEWPCNNIYTRCNNAWTCLNGDDELNCRRSVSFPCPDKHYPCVSPSNFSRFCLSITRLNDDIIDCLGATDERAYCRKETAGKVTTFRYRCSNSTACVWPPSCLAYETSCDFVGLNFENECSSFPNLFTIIGDLDDDNELEFHSATRIFIFQHSDIFPSFLSFVSRNTTGSTSVRQEQENTYKISYRDTWVCNRGLAIKFGPEKVIRCLCPPSYYGDRCQYQAQRVSLSLQFQRICSPSCHGIFTLIIFLFDIQTESIHSREIITYIAEQDCYRKFHTYLLYRDRPKNESLSYSVRIDVYERSGKTSTYYASYYVPVKLSFLPVNRVAALLTLPAITPTIRRCTKFCGKGQCMFYTNTESSSYCLCETDWSGSNCTIPYKCNCSSDALCVGNIGNKSSTCICPLRKFGPRCMLLSVCETKKPCKNNGICVPDNFDPYRYTCICQNDYTGFECERMNTKIVISFHGTDIPQSLLAHFITVHAVLNPTSITLPAKIRFDQDEAVFYFPQEFHIGLVQILDKYYLIFLQELYKDYAVIKTEVSPFRQCPSIRELMGRTWPLLRRVKYYHSICKKRPKLPCFHDEDTFVCLCTTERHANCFDFDFNQTSYKCQVTHDCQNNAQCFQDRPCPNAVLCICSECFYGSQCQLTTNGFGLNLDSILGYQIRPHIGLSHQLASVKISFALTFIMLLMGTVGGTFSIMTFQTKRSREVGCGTYLLSSAIVSSITMIVFALKFVFLLITQMSLVTNRTFLKFNCVSMDFLSRSLLATADWLNACVAIERAFMIIQGIHFNKNKSKRIACWIVTSIVLVTFLSVSYEPIHRYLIDDTEEDRVWCTVQYSAALTVLNSAFNIIHFTIPYSINLTSAIVIVIALARRSLLSHKKLTFKQYLWKQLQQHQHTLISPLILVLLALPRLIISFVSGCMKSARNPWLFLIAYFVSFVPTLLHFAVFVLPSTTYKKQLENVLKRIRRRVLYRQ